MKFLHLTALAALVFADTGCAGSVDRSVSTNQPKNQRPANGQNIRKNPTGALGKGKQGSKTTGGAKDTWQKGSTNGQKSQSGQNGQNDQNGQGGQNGQPPSQPQSQPESEGQCSD
jgi:hypothetical protein